MSNVSMKGSLSHIKSVHTILRLRWNSRSAYGHRLLAAGLPACSVSCHIGHTKSDAVAEPESLRDSAVEISKQSLKGSNFGRSSLVSGKTVQEMEEERRNESRV